MKIRTPMFKALLFASFMFSFSPAFATKIYLWYTYEDGRKVPNYGETPPLGVEAILVTEESAENKATEAQSTEKSQDSEKQLSKKQQALVAKREEDCRFEKERLNTLRSNRSRIRMAMEDGTTRYLSPEEISNEIKNSESFISQACAN